MRKDVWIILVVVVALVIVISVVTTIIVLERISKVTEVAPEQATAKGIVTLYVTGEVKPVSEQGRVVVNVVPRT